MDWWMWIAGGVALMVLELATPSGFFIMFFGLGALTVGVLAKLGLVEAWWVQWLLFTLLSIAYLIFFRGKVQQRFQAIPGPPVDSLVGAVAMPQEIIGPGAVGRVEVRGSAWSARNVAPAALTPGQRCTVVSVDKGLMLSVRPE
jgi:membrane protein implicated in regulation of membrane protease activity